MQFKVKSTYLLVLEPRPNVSKFFVNTHALRLLILAIPHIADEHRQPSHPRERHRQSRLSHCLSLSLPPLLVKNLPGIALLRYHRCLAPRCFSILIADTEGARKKAEKKLARFSHLY